MDVDEKKQVNETGTMTSNCQNCTNELQGKYCSNCGQIAETHKINIYFLWHDIQHGLLHMDKGILYTAKELFKRPGHSIREFIEGKRVRHFKPISLVLVLAGIYGFLSHYFEINLLAHDFSIDGSGEKFNELKELFEKKAEWISQHYSVLALLQIPVFTLSTYICFKKVGYNFMEHLVINTFLIGQRLILHIVAFPLYFILNSAAAYRAEQVTDIIGYGFFIWSLLQLFSGLPKAKRVWRSLFSLAIALSIMFLVFIGVVIYFASLAES